MKPEKQNKKVMENYSTIFGFLLLFSISACSQVIEGSDPGASSVDSEKSTEVAEEQAANLEEEIEQEPTVFFDLEAVNTTNGIQPLTSAALRDLMRVRDRQDGTVEKGGTDFFDTLYALGHLPGPIPDQFSTDAEWEAWRSSVKDTKLPDVVISPECTMVGEHPEIEYDVENEVLRYRSRTYSQTNERYNYNSCEEDRLSPWSGYPFDNSNSMSCVKLAAIKDGAEDPKLIQAMESNGAWSSAANTFDYVFDVSDVDPAHIYSEKSQYDFYFSPKYGLEIEVPLPRDEARDSFSEISCRYVVEPRYPFLREWVYLYQGDGAWVPEFFVRAKAIAFYNGEDEFALVNLQRE